MESPVQSQQTSEFESIDLEVYSTPKYPAETPKHETGDLCQADKSTSNEDAPVNRNSSIPLDEDTKILWKRCKALLGSEKRITILFIISACIHLCVLVSVTVSVSVIIIIISFSYSNVIQVCQLKVIAS